MKTIYFFLSAFLTMSMSTAFGQTWWPQNSQSNNDFNVLFALNNSTVWAYGDSSDIFGGYAYGSQYKTINQGFNWEFLDMGSPLYSARGVEFISPGIGILVGRNELSGNGFVRTTVNGGLSWDDQVPHAEKLEGVTYANSQLVYACGRNDYFIRSIDGGMTWQNFDANTGDHLIDLDFTNDTMGYVVGRGGVIASTIDGAANWSNLNSGTGEDLEGVWFINDSTGWAVGTAGTIIFTNDFGQTWVAQTSGTGEHLFDVEFVNDTVGWVVGTAGVVLKTEDAGANWMAETSGTNEDIISISMISETLGWFAGTAGVIHIYSMSPPNSISENHLIELNIFPNPATSSFILNFSEDLENTEISIVEISGKEIYHDVYSKNMEINVENYSSGIYFVNVLKESSLIGRKKLIIR